MKKIIDNENLKVKQGNLKIILPFLEGVALEEDETLQDMWTKLFINYIDAEKTSTVTVYPEILKQLSSTEVAILNRGVERHGRLSLIGMKTKDIENYLKSRSITWKD